MNPKYVTHLARDEVLIRKPIPSVRKFNAEADVKHDLPMERDALSCRQRPIQEDMLMKIGQ
ncbi:hypothetical protein EOS_26055 [Caballeronia mineralivorans PML1(12)]|uniref:Uncharacterized protein n=1 Tax=Caballeronia mineralivorans PML1(12) TaxID=908627 RepID=A0A0J1CRU3_9BURK|nr:hypothetical protein EOS_26055 [Caballeronia mineralivorans PML1(12)]